MSLKIRMVPDDGRERLKRISEIDDADPFCKTCDGEGWVCEFHHDKAWGCGDGCCGGAGSPCHCNPLHKDQQEKMNEKVKTELVYGFKGKVVGERLIE